MSHPAPGSMAPRNRLLAALATEDLACLWPHLEPVEVPVRQVMVRSGEPIADVFFPEAGWASMVLFMADGRVAEVGLVGREGLIGLPVLLGGNRSDVEVMAQTPGTMLRLPAEQLLQAAERSTGLRALLLRYALAFHQQVAQTAACNGHHALDQRLARWLLMAHDRADGDNFLMTQEYLAMMLCVHRPAVTVAARQFQQAGLIRYSQGRITITDREGLERAACECHDAVRRRFRRLLGPDAQ